MCPQICIPIPILIALATLPTLGLAALAWATVRHRQRKALQREEARQERES